MKLTITILYLLLQLQSIAQTEYYLGKTTNKKNNHTTDYTIAERKNDSLKIWYLSIYKKEGIWFSRRFEDEKIIFLPTVGKNFTILKISKKIIYGSGIYLNKTEKTKNIFKLINTLNRKEIDNQFLDSVKKILQIESRNVILGNTKENTEINDSLLNNSPIDSFELNYKKYSFSQLLSVRVEMQEKKTFYEALVNGNYKLDSITFIKFIDKYKGSYYDRKSFYHFILTAQNYFF